MRLLQGHWKAVTINASRLFLGVFRVSSRCSCGDFGWYSKAPLLHHFFDQAVPLGHYLGMMGGLVKGMELHFSSPGWNWYPQGHAPVN